MQPFVEADNIRQQIIYKKMDKFALDGFKPAKNSRWSKRIGSFTVRLWYKTWHSIKGCPESTLTEDYVVRYCHRCTRMQYANREVKRLMKQQERITQRST